MIKNKIAHVRKVASIAWQPLPTPPKRLIGADDDALLRQRYTEMLARADYEVDTAEAETTAWDALQVNGYALLISDHTYRRLPA